MNSPHDVVHRDDDAAATTVGSVEGPAAALEPGVIAKLGATGAAPYPSTLSCAGEVLHQGGSDRVPVAAWSLTPPRIESVATRRRAAAI